GRSPFISLADDALGIHAWRTSSRCSPPRNRTAEDRPELWEHAEASFPVVRPDYNLHGDVHGGDS
ncbi:MAG TPA: hypothetical protein VGR08_12495, partial [Thermomicrobiales bacterium]|nr:hypothetical protein [Thermomicrobiales bacterium]